MLSTIEPAGERSLVEESEWTATRILVVALCFLMNMLDGTDLTVMSYVAPILSKDWSVSPEALGVLFSASLAGMAIGCLLVAPLADRIGRRPMLLGALTLTAASMLISSATRDIAELMLARLIVGIGVGTIGVTMTTIAAEYAPKRYSSFAVGLVQAGWPFGAIITAFACAQMLQSHGWQSMFLGIGFLSVALLAVIYWQMPESLAFLVLRQPLNALTRINSVRQRMNWPALTALPPQLSHTQPTTQLLALFQEGRAWRSVLLWSAVTLGYFDLYFVISWIPKLANQAGLPLSQAIYAGGTYNLGAFIGTSAVGWLGTRFALERVVATYLAFAAVVMLIFGGIAMPVWLTLLMAFCVGVSVQGGFNGFWAIAARLYPPEMRNTGVGWALGVGRIGAVMGPIIGGVLVGAHMTLALVFAIYAIPLVLAALMTLRLRLNS